MKSPATKKCKMLFTPDDQKRMQYWQIRQSLSNNKQDKLRTERAGVQCCKDLAACLSSVYRKHNGSIQPFQGLSRGFMQCLHYINLLDVPLSFYNALLNQRKTKHRSYTFSLSKVLLQMTQIWRTYQPTTKYTLFPKKLMVHTRVEK